MRSIELKKTAVVRARPFQDVRVRRPLSLVQKTFRLKSAHETKGRRSLVSSGSIILACLIVVALLTQSAGYTFSYFIDIDRSQGNSLRAGTLDFTLESGDSTNVYIGTEDGSSLLISPGAVSVPDAFPLQYTIKAEKTGGSNAFCSLIQVASTASDPFSYEGPLLALSTGTTTSQTAWPLTFTMTGNTAQIPQGDLCTVDLVYRGSVSQTPGSGYRDEERIHLTFRARQIVINEFLPNPEGSAFGFDFGDDASLKPQGEWVELYNNASTSINVNGWYIWDGSVDNSNKVFISSVNTNSGETTIPAHGWLAVYLNKAILDNDHDEVRLYNLQNELTDTFAYDGHDVCEHEPTAGTANGSSTAGGVCGVVPPNKSYARIPDGLGPRIDPIPTPGFANNNDAVPVQEVLKDELVVVEESSIVESPATSTESSSSEEVVVETPVPEIVEEESLTPEIVPEEPHGTSGAGTSDQSVVDESEDVQEQTLPEEVTNDEPELEPVSEIPASSVPAEPEGVPEPPVSTSDPVETENPPETIVETEPAQTTEPTTPTEVVSEEVPSETVSE